MDMLSDGITDGFALFYIKDGKLKTVLLNKDKAEELDILLTAWYDEKVVIATPNDLKKYL